LVSSEHLPAEQRARHYRDCAAAALAQAADAETEESRAEYLKMAANWHELATALEHPA